MQCLSSTPSNSNSARPRHSEWIGGFGSAGLTVIAPLYNFERTAVELANNLLFYSLVFFFLLLTLTWIFIMNYTNPYAQAGWSNPGNPSSRGQSQWSSHPPTFGALPYPEHSAPPAKRFIFSSQGPRLIQGCDVVDGNSGATVFKIKMARDGYDYTSLQSPNGTPRGYILWKSEGPEIEVYGVVSRRKAKDWLGLSPDQSSRFMQLRDKHYVWQFARDAMYLYGYELNKHQQLGKIYPVNDGTTVFETNQSLIDNGMLESVTLVITLLLSERFRD